MSEPDRAAAPPYHLVVADDWMSERAKQLRRAVGRLGMILPAEEATQLIAVRVAAVAEQLDINSHTARAYLTDDVVESMALAITSAGQPLVPAGAGENLYDRPRTSQVPLALTGRMIAGLAESIKAETLHFAGRSPHVADAAELLSLLGLIIADQDTLGATIAAPPDLLILIADELSAAADATSDLPGSEDLVRTLRTDATKARACIPALPRLQ